MDLWLGFDDWLKSNNILQRGYQGRGWNGNNSILQSFSLVPLMKNLERQCGILEPSFYSIQVPQNVH